MKSKQETVLFLFYEMEAMEERKKMKHHAWLYLLDPVRGLCFSASEIDKECVM